MTHNAWHGKLVTLRDVEPADWEAFYGFDQDSDAQRHGWEVHFPRSREGSKQWAEEKAKKKSEDDNHFFAITDPNLVLVGSISAHGCDRRNGAFKYGIGLGRDFWQKGYGTDAMRVMFRYYFRRTRAITVFGRRSTPSTNGRSPFTNPSGSNARAPFARPITPAAGGTTWRCSG